MENSIEDTKKQLELMLKVRKEQKEILECAGGSCMNCDPDIKALSRSIEILSDYKRVLKENECLKNHVHYKNCIVCGKEFKSKRDDAKYCIKCSKQIANKNYIANLTEEQKLKRREQAKLAMRKLRANRK